MVFGTGFHSLNNEIHSDNQAPGITATLSIGGSLTGQNHQATTITVTITLTDDEGQPEQVSNFIDTDIFPSNCVVESFAMHDNYTKYTFNLRSITINDGTNLCSATLAAGVFSDKANSPSPSLTINWYPDIEPPSPTIEFTNLSQFTHHVNDFGGDVGAGTAWPPYDGGSLLGNEYYAAASPIDIEIYMNEYVIGFNPAIYPTGHVHIDNGASWVTLPTTTDNIRWTGQLNLQPGITTMVINAGQFQDRAQNNTNSAINNNDDGPGSRSVSYDTTAPTIQSETLYGQNNSTNIGNNARTNDDYVYLHITLSEPDTNFDTRDYGDLFNTTNCTIDDMTHVGGNTFRVKITPNSSGNPFTQCEFSLKPNTFIDRSQNTGPPSAGSSGGGTSWTWKHDDIVPTLTFEFTDGTVGSSDGSDSPNTTSFIATGNVTGVLNFSEDVLNVGTGNIEEIGTGGGRTPLGTASSVSGSGSNYTWTFSGIPAATTAMSPTPLVFKYNHGSVTDLGGSAVSPTPSNIYVEYGDPVIITMLFDTDNDNEGEDSTILNPKLNP